MKKIKNIFSLLLMFISILACSGDGDSEVKPDLLEQRLEELMNGGTTWNVISVTKDSYDVTDQFNGFKLTVGEFTYTTTNGLSSAWPAQGTWAFVNENPNQVIRDNETTMSVSISGNQLTLSFTVTGLSGGRAESVDGDYVFVLE